MQSCLDTYFFRTGIKLNNNNWVFCAIYYRDEKNIYSYFKKYMNKLIVLQMENLKCSIPPRYFWEKICGLLKIH